MICRCPKCGKIGERHMVGEYIEKDTTFKCKKCGYRGGENSCSKQ